eukprot:550426-Prorocentrum_minimum.AAC.1
MCIRDSAPLSQSSSDVSPSLDPLVPPTAGLLRGSLDLIWLFVGLGRPDRHSASASCTTHPHTSQRMNE